MWRQNFLLFLFGVLGLVAGTTIVDEDGETFEVSDEAGFKEAAKNILDAYDPAKNPCHNFYDFACGQIETKFKKHAALYNLDSFGLTAITQGRALNIVKGAFNDTFKSSEALRKLRFLYASCQNVEKRIASKELAELVKQFGGFPLVEGKKWDAKGFDLTRLLIEGDRHRDLNVLHEHADENNKGILIEILPYKNVKTNAPAIYLGTASLLFDAPVLLEPWKAGPIIGNVRERLTKLTRLTAEQLGLPFHENHVRNGIDEVIEFETKLAKVESGLVDEENEAYRNLSDAVTNRLAALDEEGKFQASFENLTEFQKYLPQVDWERYFLAFSDEAFVNYLKANEAITIEDAEVTSKLILFLAVIFKTEPRIVQNYVILRALYRTGVDSIYTQPETAEALCLGDILNKMRQASGALFAHKAFPPEEKKEADHLASSLRDAFRELLKENKWLDETTRKEALQKLDKMHFVVGHRELAADDKLLDDYYKELVLNESLGSYLDNERALSIWKNNRYFKKTLEKGDASTAIVIVNAQYNKLANHLGASYDAEGRKRNWWSPATLSDFQKRGACLVKQYNKAKVTVGEDGKTSVHGNGQKTLGENIADLGGLKESFRAYQNFVKKNGPEKRLPGLEGYTSNQVFFLAAAQVLKNIPEFAKAFHCPIGSRMYPQKTERCEIW